MSHNPHHEHLVKEVAGLFKPILAKSPQAIYIYLDDEHKICNKRFSDMLGYKSPQEWVENLYPVSDVDKKDQKKAISAYMDASKKLKASSIQGTWVTKDGKKVKTLVTMTPFSYKDEVFVLHFISPVK